jgi:cysteinyl-tRNA synthetase
MGYNPLSFRYMCLNTSYRKQLLFSFDALKQAEDAYLKLKNRESNIPNEGELDKEQFDTYNNRFKEEIANDINMPNALAILYEVLKDNNLNGKTKLELIENFDKVFSLDLTKKEEKNIDDAWILELIEKRKEAKKEKNFEEADKIRNELLEKGIELIDSREGTTYRIK